MLPPMDEGQNAARLAGLLAMLALPMVRQHDGSMRRRIVEVEYEPGRWSVVEGATVEADRLILWSGSNGTRAHREFSARACPPWRTDRPVVQRYMNGDLAW